VRPSRPLVVRGGPGENSIDLSGVAKAAFTSLASVLVDGGDGADTMVGSPSATCSWAGPAATRSRVARGTTVLSGGLGDDQLTGELGTDTVTGGGGVDIEDGETMPPSDFTDLGPDLETYLQNVQDRLDGVFARPLPLVGTQLGRQYLGGQRLHRRSDDHGQFIAGTTALPPTWDGPEAVPPRPRPATFNRPCTAR